MKQLSGTHKIFEDIQVGALKIPNRIVAAPFCTRLSTPEGFATPELINYWQQRASGGCGLVIVEACYIDDECSRAERNMLGAFDSDCHVGLAQIAESIKINGSKAFLQLVHSGRQTLPTAIGGRETLAPSAIPCPYMSYLWGGPNPTKEITVEEIKGVTENYVKAAERAKEVGFDGIELHFGHGYLVGSFLSSYMNKRTDEYGGSLENRAKVGLEIFERCKMMLGENYPIGVRLTADEYVEGGITLEETKQVSKWYEEAGIGYIHVSASNYETVETQCPTIYQKKGFLVHLAEGIKEAVNIPVIAVAALTYDLAMKVIEEKKADMVAIGRGMNADPQMARKMAEGHPEDIIPCIRCNRCLEAEGQDKPTRCDVNFLTGRSLAYPIVPAMNQGKVIVVGGGPSGMEAARVAALRGHDVKLYEKNSRLGGALIPASTPEFMGDFKSLINYYEVQLEKLGVEVVLNKQVDATEVKKEKPDTIVVAVGGKSATVKVPGRKNPIVIQAVETMTGDMKLGDEIIIVGGSFIACQIAAHWAKNGKKVTIASARNLEEQFAGEIEPVSKGVLLRLLNDLNVNINPDHFLVEIVDDGAIFDTTKNGRTKVIADNVLLATGFLPKKVEVNKFKGLAPRVFATGDCVRPRRIGPAIHEGFIAGYEA